MARVRTEQPKSFYLAVAGVTFEGRQRVLKKHCREGDPVRLEREPENRHSRTAVAVWVRKRAWILRGWARAGYVPEEDSAEISKLLKQGWEAQATIHRVVGGGWIRNRTRGLRLEVELRPPGPAPTPGMDWT